MKKSQLKKVYCEMCENISEAIVNECLKRHWWIQFCSLVRRYSVRDGKNDSKRYYLWNYFDLKTGSVFSFVGFECLIAR